MNPIFVGWEHDFYHITSLPAFHLSNLQNRHCSNVLHLENIILKVSLDYALSLQLNMTDHGTYINGMLLHANGGTVFVDSRYRHTFSKQFEICHTKGGNFKVQLEKGLIHFKGWFKIDKNQLMFHTQIQTIILEIKKCMSQALTTLEKCGLRRSSRKNAFGMKKAYINLRKKVFQILSNSQSLKQKLPSVFTFDTTQNQSPAIKIIEQICQQKKVEGQQSPIRRGGYFQIEKKILKISTQDHESQEKNFAIKKAKKNSINSLFCREKIKRQWEIIKNICLTDHCLIYYKQIEEIKANQSMIMDYVKSTLGTFIKNKALSIYQIIEFASQIIDSVGILHASNIIHRDLKPQNFLVQEINDKYKLRVIDFGESALTTEVFKPNCPHNLGSTPPYSPIQCIMNCQEGFNHQEIDFWSLGIIFYELIFQRLPVCFSNCFAQDIALSWKQQFCSFSNVRKKSGLKVIEQMIGWITEFTLNFFPKKRLSLPILKYLLQKLKKFSQKI